MTDAAAPRRAGEPRFLTAFDGNRVWCVRCKGWKRADGESNAPCPDDTPNGACPIQEGDETKWQSVTGAQAQEAIDALAGEMSELDDSAAARIEKLERELRIADQDADREIGALRARLTERDAATPRTPAPSVFTQPDVAYQAMRDFATRCDGRKKGRCKSCAFLLKALDEIQLLRSQLGPDDQQNADDVVARRCLP